jgi:hypothetical protein
MAAEGEAAARSRSSERATKGSHQSAAGTVLVPAPPLPPEVEAVAPPLAMAGERWWRGNPRLENPPLPRPRMEGKGNKAKAGWEEGQGFV